MRRLALRKPDSAIPKPAMKIGDMLSTLIDESYVLEAEKVVPIEKKVGMLTDKLASERFDVFAQLLKASGFWERL